MSLSVHPLAPETIGGPKVGSLPSQPQWRHATRPSLGESESDEPYVVTPSAMSVSRIGKGTKGTVLRMANPDRAYNQWPSKSLAAAFGLLV